MFSCRFSIRARWLACTLRCFLSSTAQHRGLDTKRVLETPIPFNPTSGATTRANPRYHGFHHRRSPCARSRRARARRRPSREQAKAQYQRTHHRPCRALVANPKRHSRHCQRVCALKNPTLVVDADIPSDMTPSRLSSSTHSATLTPRNPHTKSSGSRPRTKTKRRPSSASCKMAHTHPCHSSKPTPCM